MYASPCFPSLRLCVTDTSLGLSFFPASYSQYKSEDGDGRASSATRPSSSGSGQTYTPTLTPTPTPTPTPSRTTTSNSPSNNAATKTGKAPWLTGENVSNVLTDLMRHNLLLIQGVCSCVSTVVYSAVVRLFVLQTRCSSTRSTRDRG